MNGQLENLKAELLPLEQQRIKLDEMTRSRTNTLLWLGMGGMYVFACFMLPDFDGGGKILTII